MHTAWGGERDVHVKALVPVGVQRLLDDARGARLLAVDCGHGEGVREACGACVSGASAGARAGQVRTEDIALVEAIGGDDCVVLAVDLRVCVQHCARRRAASSEKREARGAGAEVLGAEVLGDALVTRRLGWPAASMVMRRRRRVLVEGLRVSASGRLSELAGVWDCYQRSVVAARGLAVGCKRQGRRRTGNGRWATGDGRGNRRRGCAAVTGQD